jgi:GH25 family lysozyme M1 (1,4-beta-N-acetylmuramidase)
MYGKSAALAAALVSLSLLLGSLAPAAAAAKGAPKPPKPPVVKVPLEGLDVSQWQGPIDWAQVAAAGKRFALIRASAGNLTDDTTYATNRAGAKAAGLKVAAYHYANPCFRDGCDKTVRTLDDILGDALSEADHFLARATPASGDLLPILDLEAYGQSAWYGGAALTTDELQAWVSTWLEEVRSTSGVQAMIYVSPNFWTIHMADSTAFAQAGYKFLWIAHWGVAAPRIPAANWDGNGWTFWQYTNFGSVPGVSGRVDLDRYKGSTFDRALFIP